MLGNQFRLCVSDLWSSHPAAYTGQGIVNGATEDISSKPTQQIKGLGHIIPFIMRIAIVVIIVFMMLVIIGQTNADLLFVFANNC